LKIVEIWRFQTEWNTKKVPAAFASPEWRGMVFIETGGVLAGSAGYYFKTGRVWRDTGGVFQLLETQLAITCNSTIIEVCKDIF
jgi:hypothetical protein